MSFQPVESWIRPVAQPLLIAGPCSAESEEQVLETAKQLKNTGRVSLFRAGVWKPRTRPDTFEGRGEIALEWLSKVKTETGLPVTVEVANSSHVEKALRHGIDVLWIGARTTVNPFTVQEIADSLRGTGVPVMIKNPIHGDLQLWAGAIERVYRAGCDKLAAVHRGFHFYGKSPYRNQPMWQIPIELRTMFPQLPMFCDPSHIGGSRELVLPIAQKALDIGMDGLMIESHVHPEKAMSDAAQQVTPAALDALVARLIMRSADAGISDNRLSQLRRMIDEIDDELLHTLRKRVQVIEEIGEYKKDHNITIFQLERWQEILKTRGQWADQLGLGRYHVERLCQLLHEESIRIQNGIMNQQNDPVD